MKTELVIRKLKSTSGGVSRREVLLVALIAVMTLFFAFEGMHYLDMQQRKGNDALRENTAISVARVNSNNGLSCPVENCDGRGGKCAHFDGECYIGFYDDVNNTIVGRRPRGYNEYDTMTIDGVTWHGEPGTMVIRVVVKDADVKLSWEIGRK